VHFVDTQTGGAVGGVEVLGTRNSGTTWAPQIRVRGEHLEGVNFAESSGWAVGWDGTILATATAGATWQPQNSRTEKNLFVMYFADARAGWAICGESR